MPRLTGGQAVVEQLERQGVEVVFGMPGVHTLDIYDAVIDSDIDHVTTRHEQGAGFMADGYARATGRVGVALVITGPGLTNAATPIGQAYSDSSPLLVISSENETNEAGRGKGYLHELKDQQGVMESIAADSEEVTRVADIPKVIAEAFEYLQSHRPRPVHLQIPTDVLAREEEVDLLRREGNPATASRESPDEERLDAAADRLAAADRPLLLVGGGASGAAEQARRLAESAGTPVVSTVAGKGVVPEDHPLSLGATMGEEAVAAFVESRDLVLAVGTELSPREVRDIDLPENLVQIDIDYRNFGKTFPVELGIVADAADALAELASEVENRGIQFGDHTDRVADLRGEAAATDRDDRHRILETLRESLDDDAVVVNDMTKICYEAMSEFPASEPDTFLFPRGYGTLGFSPPAAYGAAVGLPDRQVVSMVGDGGLMFTIQDLATAVKYDLGVPVIVLNDECYGVVDDVQQRDYGRTVGTDIENPDFVAMARAFGAAAERIDVAEVEDALPTALESAFARDRPTLIEIPVDF